MGSSSPRTLPNLTREIAQLRKLRWPSKFLELSCQLKIPGLQTRPELSRKMRRNIAPTLPSERQDPMPNCGESELSERRKRKRQPLKLNPRERSKIFLLVLVCLVFIRNKSTHSPR